MDGRRVQVPNQDLTVLKGFGKGQHTEDAQNMNERQE